MVVKKYFFTQGVLLYFIAAFLKLFVEQNTFPARDFIVASRGKPHIAFYILLLETADGIAKTAVMPQEQKQIKIERLDAIVIKAEFRRPFVHIGDIEVSAVIGQNTVKI